MAATALCFYLILMQSNLFFLSCLYFVYFMDISNIFWLNAEHPRILCDGMVSDHYFFQIFFLEMNESACS
jgi:hypothetical protein